MWKIGGTSARAGSVRRRSLRRPKPRRPPPQATAMTWKGKIHQTNQRAASVSRRYTDPRLQRIRRSSYHPFAQFFQRILRPAPHDAIVPEREEHGAQQSIDEKRGAHGMQQKVI